ncbi:ovostatin homolog 2-like [Callospermophilus lateralis]|uniref:ovostatin homolog 2-like n=1 Tax=Callospermophilus lateralis TaxID=76772 RepID=UPI0040541901
MVPTILLSTFLLHWTIAVASKLQYILWVPSVIQSYSAEIACLHLLNLNESVSLSVFLEYDGSNTTIFDLSVGEDTFYACADFKVSQKSSEQFAFVTLLAKGDTLTIFERRSVAISSEEKVTFVQTDKPIYKPGENVKFRIVTLDTRFKPTEDLYPLITLQDPQNNKIFQWQNVTSFRNITQLSFQLISEPMIGDYTIVVKGKSGNTLIHEFTVNRYVLPKFEVKVSAPQTITISDDEFQVDTCAKYTYGQSVQGKAQIRICRKFFSSTSCENENNEICEQFIAQLKNGCVSQIVPTKIFQFYRSGLFMTLNINVVVTEFGTGVQISEKTSIFITPLLGRVNFENTDPFYRRGIYYFGTLKFYGPNNVPLVSKLLQLELNDKFIGNYTTDEDGEAQFSIDTSDIFDPEFNLKASYVQPKSCYPNSWLTPEYSDAYFRVSRFYSRTSSFLKIAPEPKQLRCNQQKIITIHYSLNPDAYKDDSHVNFYYLMMVKGVIFLSGQKEIKNKAWNGNFSFPISISADLAPVAVLFVYTLHPSGEIVADSVKFQIEKCFKNKVSIKFHKEQGLPGSNASLNLQAAPDSFCALRAVDKSVLLLKSEQQLSAESVYNLLPNIEPYGYFYHGLNLDDGKVNPCIPQKNMFYNGLYYMPINNYGDGDIYDIVRDMGLKAFTNLHYRKPEICSEENNLPFPRPPEGVEKEMTQSFLICTKGARASEDIVLDLPNNVIEGSARAFVTVVGDILGVAKQNLDNLVQVPYESGEQNIALLSSNTYVLDYLKFTEQLTEEFKSKTFFLLSNGYQKQLSFRNSDGSYSLFWQWNRKGSIWLTALTFKTLEKMKECVFIDETVQKQSLIWLSSKQKSNGCFENDDKLFNKKGGDEEDILLTAYILGALLEAGLSATFPVLHNGLFCLEEALESGVSNGHTQAILAYAFALAGKEEKVEALFQILDQSAVKINNVIYWEREKKPNTEESPSYTPWAHSGDNEKTCYVLLAVISWKTQDLSYASKIVQWLAQQMNSHGGFSSSQDTIVCLLAITRYMKLTFSSDQNTITFRSQQSNEIFQINNDNRLLVQHLELTKAHGQYTVDVEGHGCTFIQATLKYNVPLPKEASGFSLSLNIVKNNSSDIFQANFDLTVTFKYTGIHNNSIMVLVDVKMLSGFTPILTSIQELENNVQVMKTEVKNDHVLFYMENVPGIVKSFTFSVEQSNLVYNIQPAPVMVYNYYEKDEYAFNSYNINNIPVF